MGRILGLDFGTKRVGAAVSDPRREIATPLEVYERRDPTQDARHYRQLVEENEVEWIVVGLPVHLGGQTSGSAVLARKWGDWLAEATGLRIVYVDERFTTVEAEESLIAAGIKRSRRKGLRDMLAARLLLQNYLDDGCPLDPIRAAPLADASEPTEDS